MVGQHTIDLLGKFFSKVSSVSSRYRQNFPRFLWWALANSSNYGCDLEGNNEVWVTCCGRNCLKSVTFVIMIESMASVCQGRSSLLPFSGPPWKRIAPQPDGLRGCICRVKCCCLALMYTTDNVFSSHPTLYAVSLSRCVEQDCKDISEIHYFWILVSESTGLTKKYIQLSQICPPLFPAPAGDNPRTSFLFFIPYLFTTTFYTIFLLVISFYKSNVSFPPQVVYSSRGESCHSFLSGSKSLV